MLPVLARHVSSMQLPCEHCLESLGRWNADTETHYRMLVYIYIESSLTQRYDWEQKVNRTSGLRRYVLSACVWLLVEQE